MRFNKATAAATAVLLSTATTAQEATKYYDPETGITFSSITHNNGVTHRVALPAEPPTEADAILQIVSPIEFGWCGLAWGGRMANNPLSVGWSTGLPAGESPQGIVSNRMAFGYYAVPGPYNGATHTIFPSGTRSNATHWQVTARCQGCTRWSSSTGAGDSDLHAEDVAVLAYACATTPVDDPMSNTTTFNQHDQFNIWGHDLTLGKNASYSEWVGGGSGGGNASLARRWWG